MKLIVAFTFFLSQLIIGAWNIDNTFINVAKHTDELMLVRAIQIIDPANAWAITHNNLYRYQDSTWSEKSPGGPFSLMSINFKDTREGWIGCAGSIFLKFTDNTFTQANLQPYSNIRAITNQDSNSLEAAGEMSVIFHYNPVNNWVVDTTVYSPHPYAFNDISFSDKNHGWAVGSPAIPEDTLFYVFTYNYGAWQIVAINQKVPLLSVYAIDSATAWIVGGSGTILKLEGGSWHPFASPTNHHLNKVFFVDKMHGWAVGDSGTILYFNGQTWQVQNSGTTLNLYSVSFSDTMHGWVSGDAFTVLKTNNGGAIATEKSGTARKELNLNIKPNPFNPTAQIVLENPSSGKIKLAVYNIQGQMVSQIIDRTLKSGIYTFNFDGHGLPSGTYILSLKAGNKMLTKKMVLLR
ncbi:MAG: hypothetical protein A2268_14295 [Candidatus Raymondbacteria bacterium RifOxyA12_full_50_37]|uniref:Secretion system C-terminal sorting domain-containing protein n=1 Tax=Candidatus Raymondbacteria bacterium RIFOXYD12_FULL_49_13 TaxID=1817890 RepID=A0A1F7FKQ9_UNCRA|nr:MAG: hypothetical protein A2268_14295 [Candidatus Raymondbacteria bacterium RifOxyA12_full_50_37]OGJ86929.1 MAG: hypothetical protein A2350_02210 [Candidatus Raymondbacteria bacterium RifOxyB12_full_50_8]OGJ88250.1 MAG: hypothetical protein A2248_19635 [Candidatus Raymondbacteria bacterium RIFOXYA2_FULL_49_16]OGK05752.1 MAG: hypothetical protein A2487_19605 [Candidatus Raymondbacteria bacterium RifOxyC12_full_50_8]OGK07295.1 MAG: hypothetical protein A2519_14305 [Candidatus Raymondbacteria b